MVSLSFAFSVLAILLCLSAKVKGDDFNVNCVFAVLSNIYTCQLIGVTIPDDEELNFIIGGQHLPGRTNSDVSRITIQNSNTPFIVPQLFETFPNTVDFFLANGALNRIQSNAFADAAELRLILITGNREIEEIQADAFKGATNLFVLDMFANRIESIDEHAFNGLDSLMQIFLENNELHELPPHVFRPLKLLQVLFLNNNLLEVLDGRLLASNTQITSISISINQINAIGRTFFDNLENLQFFAAVGNECVDNNWAITGDTTIDTIREELSECFDNFVEPEPDNEIRRFIIEVRGPFALYYEDGTEIIRI